MIKFLIIFFILYLLLLIFWLVVNCFFYALTVITKKQFFSIPFILNTLFGWVVSIAFVVYPFYYSWNYIREILSANPEIRGWGLIPLIIVGLFLLGIYIYFWQMIVGTVSGLLVFPIVSITTFFSQKGAEKLTRKEEEFDYEVLSPTGEVISKHQSWGKIEKEMSKWFIIGFIISFIRQLLRLGDQFFNGFLVHTITPMLTMILMCFILGAITGGYNLIRKRGFFGENKYVFTAKILKTFSVIYGLSLTLELLFYLSG